MVMTIDLHIDRLDWDEWNREHITKHDVTQQEATEVVRSRPLIEEAYKGRYRLIGDTLHGQILVVIVGENPETHGLFYVFSARPASRRERERLQVFREGQDAR
jgi:uncharacterized DUF497 family protein